MSEEYQKLAALVPAAAREVVVFGCTREAVAMAEALGRRSPAMRVHGFAATRAEAAAVAPSMASVARGRAEDVDLLDYGIAAADCIVYTRTAYPDVTRSCLEVHLEALAPGGQMVFFVEDDVAARAAAQLLPDEMGKTATQIGGVFVLRATREPQMTVSVQTLIGEALATARVRVAEPDAFCAAEPGWFFSASSQGRVNAGLARQLDASIVVRQRTGFDTLEMAQQQTAQLLGMFGLIVYEMDDHPLHWQARYEASRYLDFRAAHAVQVSTPALAEVVRPYNPHVIVLENELAELPPARDYAAEAAAKDGRVTIFFGALNRGAEWRELVPVLERVAQKYGDKVEFVVLADTASCAALHVPHKRVVGSREAYDSQFVPYDVYTQALHSADIALLPLHDTVFNRAKSDLKFIESAGHGAAVLASPTVYARTIADGCTGCIYRDKKEFRRKLERLIEDARYRRAVARAAYGYVRDERLLSQHYRARLSAYRGLIEYREELEQERAARVAEALREVPGAAGASGRDGGVLYV